MSVEYDPIERDIDRRLALRSETLDFPASELQRELLRMLAKVVKDERYLDFYPIIYPSDDLSVLCFSRDNLTGLIFIIDTEKRYKVKLSLKELESDLSETAATVEDLLHWTESKLTNIT